MTNIINDFWEYVENNRNKKTVEKIYQWLNKDNLASIIKDNDIYWTELVCSQSTYPQYAFDFIKKWCKKRGLKYLYDMDIKENFLQKGIKL